MAEIKSTLDLIMEKTKNLTMTSEEKEALQQKELKARSEAFVRRYLDGLIDLQPVAEYLFENAGHRQTILKIMKQELLKHIDPARDNRKIADFYSNILNEDFQPVALKIDTYRNDMTRQIGEHLKALKQELAKKGISGSAVVPNLEKDPQWQNLLDSSAASFMKDLHNQSILNQ